MLKKNKKVILITTLVTLLPVLAGLCLWNRLPERIPTHWNFQGTVDGWSPKAFAVFGLPAIVLACHLLCVFGTAMDPKRKNVQGKMLTLVYWVSPIVSVLVCGASFAAALGAEFSVQIWAMALVGILLIVMGNWMPKCQPNYTIGIKLPWTLHSEENWRKTHRMAGTVWMAGGLLTVVSAFLGHAGAVIFLCAMVLMIAIPTAYSFLLYRKMSKD